MSSLFGEHFTGSNSDKFFKPALGENRIRLLTLPKMYYEFFIDNVPYRGDGSLEYVEKNIYIPELEKNNLKKGEDPKTQLKSVAAFVIFDYKSDSIKIFAISQKTIIDYIKSIHGNKEDCDSIVSQSIKITRKEEGNITKYLCDRSKPIRIKDIETRCKKSVIDLFNEASINLDALVSKEECFGSSTPTKLYSEDV